MDHTATSTPTKARIQQLSRVRKVRGYWVVEISSPVAASGWIVQGEWLTEALAREDRKNWL